MVKTRSALKRKAIEALEPIPLEPATREEDIINDQEFFDKYGARYVPRPDYRLLTQGATRLIREGGIEWAFDVSGLGDFYWELVTCSCGWAMTYLTPGIEALPADHIRLLIARVKGFCVQMDWDALRLMLPPNARDQFGQFLGELIIYLTVHERLFENPFWYLDGKEGPDDSGEDPSFGKKLNYLFERFYSTNLTYGVLWKMQTQRLANSDTRHHAPNPEFGRANADRHEAALAGFADNLLASEPFCWLLKGNVDPASREAKARRNELIDVFRKAVRTMIRCETWTSGRPVLRGIRELKGTYDMRSTRATPDNRCWRPKLDLYDNQRILVVSRPGLVYVDSIDGYNPNVSRRATEVFEAQVIPAYVEAAPDPAAMDVVEDGASEGEVDESTDGEDSEKQVEGDDDWVEGESD